ncbi:hypothetical protein HU200_024939 [Digitaria exilis]|uniref:Uncharacterized protein n=1 Tax=Digitaria exilis TaxID=1010633 RepID=A0A835C9N2_9POAL|nr:hypothetical protein HU200_024939 [Digitaria exilis]
MRMLYCLSRVLYFYTGSLTKKQLIRVLGNSIRVPWVSNRLPEYFGPWSGFFFS